MKILKAKISTVKAAKISIADATVKSLILVLSSMERLVIKLSRWFLYSFVDKNQSLNFLDPFAKKKEARSKNGVVGKIGSTTPTAPMPKNKNPSDIYNAFISLFSIRPSNLVIPIIMIRIIIIMGIISILLGFVNR